MHGAGWGGVAGVVFWLAMAPAAVAATTTRFDAPRAYPTSWYGASVVQADFDEDGSPDAAVATGSGTEIFLNAGDGLMQKSGPTLSAANMQLSAGDLDRDGHVDLVATSNSDTLLILLGNGHGRFAAAAPVVVGDNIGAQRLGDVTRDGILDLVVAWTPFSQPPRIDVYPGRGDGRFRSPTSTLLPAFPVDLALADFNGDGRLDTVVTTSIDDSVMVLLGTTGNRFVTRAQFALPAYSRSVAVGDWNGGGLDFAVASDGGSIAVFLNQGRGNFTALPAFESPGTRNLQTADFDGDGRADLAAAGGSSLDLLLGAGDGTFASHSLSRIAVSAVELALADFDGDGRLDVASADQGDLSFTLTLGRGADGLQPIVAQAVKLNPTQLASADFDEDGVADLALAYYFGNGSATGIDILLGDGAGGFAYSASLAGDSPARSVAGDFNGDGHADLAVQTSPGVRLWLGDGTGSFVSGSLSPESTGCVLIDFRSPIAPCLAAADFDADGDLDLAGTKPFSSEVVILLNQGNASFVAAPSVTAGTPQYIGSGDLNGDGLPDLTVGAYNTGVYVALNQGAGRFAAAQLLPVGINPTSIATADLDADGAADLVVGDACSQSQISLAVWTLRGIGDGSFGPAQSHPVGQCPASVAVADFSGDGLLDIATANFESHTLSLLDGNGDLGFQPQAQFRTVGGSNFLLAGDWNLDGKPDLAVTGQYDSALGIPRNVTP